VNLDIWGMGVEEGPLSEEGDFMVPMNVGSSSFTVLRRGELRLGGGIPAQERLVVAAAPPDSRETASYFFELRSPSHGERFDRPSLSLVMSNRLHSGEGKIPFRADAEAIALWDAISRSIRLRPGAI